MKYVLIMTAILALAACKDERPTTESESGLNYKAECIDGVEYWVRSTGHRGYMSVRVDPKTLSFVRCEGK
jgi:hypothetical protein